jgi:hypothetical protein
VGEIRHRGGGERDRSYREREKGKVARGPELPRRRSGNIGEEERRKGGTSASRTLFLSCTFDISRKVVVGLDYDIV